MDKYEIAVIIGSLSKNSINRKLANAILKLAPAEFKFKQLQISDLPLYNQDDDGNQSESVIRFKNEIRNAHGLLFITPEYNRSIPGALKNAVDHASRPYGQNSWDDKPAGILGCSSGPIGTAIAQQHLRNILSRLNVHVLSQPDAYVQFKEGMLDKEGSFTSENKKFFQNWMDKYVAWIKKFAY
jgi:chromate reductase, NAD(P)H dehydrogenase (quinone)